MTPRRPPSACWPWTTSSSSPTAGPMGTPSAAPAPCAWPWAAEGKDRLAPAQRGCPPPLRDPYLGGAGPGGLCPQAVVAVDVAALGMLPDSAQPYRDRIDLAIDHHGSQEGYARATCVDPDSAACGEVLFRVFQAMGVDLTPRLPCSSIWPSPLTPGALSTQHHPGHHRIAAALMDTGFDAQWVNKRHFRVKSLKRMQIESRLVREMDLAQNGTWSLPTSPWT